MSKTDKHLKHMFSLEYVTSRDLKPIYISVIGIIKKKRYVGNNEGSTHIDSFSFIS